MNARWLLSVPVVTAIVGAAVFLAIESGGSGSGPAARRTSGTQPINTGPTSVPVKVCVADVEGLWRYTYGSACGVRGATGRLPYSYHDLVVPAYTRVDLAVTADHGQHVLTISKLALRIDARPYTVQRTSFRTAGAGENYQGVCLEKCGHDPASASARVVVVSAAGYGSWLSEQTHAIAQQGAQVTQLRTDLIDEGVFARSMAATTH